jgi:hypothetical protein
MTERGPLDERVWESGWDEHARAQRRRLACLTLAEKIAWLEGAHDLVLRFQPKRPWPGHDIDPAESGWTPEA